MVVAAPAADLVEMKVPMCLGVVLVCLACVSTRLPWVLEKVTAPAERQFGSSAVLSFLALGQRWPWGVPAQDRGKWAWVEGPPLSIMVYIAL